MTIPRKRIEKRTMASAFEVLISILIALSSAYLAKLTLRKTVIAPPTINFVSSWNPAENKV